MTKRSFIAKVKSARDSSEKVVEQAAKPAEAPKPKGKNMLLAVIIIVILVVVGVGVYFLTRSTTPPTNNNGVPVSIFDGHSTCTPVTPPNCGFSPATLRIKLGVNATVTWTNNGGQAHTVTSNSTGLPPFNSPAGGMNPSGGANNQYSFTFTQAGIYHYYCSYHTWMQAVVNVTS